MESVHNVRSTAHVCFFCCFYMYNVHIKEKYIWYIWQTYSTGITKRAYKCRYTLYTNKQLPSIVKNLHRFLRLRYLPYMHVSSCKSYSIKLYLRTNFTLNKININTKKWSNWLWLTLVKNKTPKRLFTRGLVGLNLNIYEYVPSELLN